MKCEMKLSAGLLVVALLAIGCAKPMETKPAEESSSAGETAAVAEHTHGSGPNGGVVFDLGGEHAEFTVDHDKQQCTILIIDADSMTPKAVAASEFTIAINETKTADGAVVAAMTVTALPEGAVDGKAAKFVGTDPGIGNVADFEGTVSGEIDGKPAQGSFKE